MLHLHDGELITRGVYLLGVVMVTAVVDCDTPFVTDGLGVLTEMVVEALVEALVVELPAVCIVVI